MSSINRLTVRNFGKVLVQFSIFIVAAQGCSSQNSKARSIANANNQSTGDDNGKNSVENDVSHQEPKPSYDSPSQAPSMTGQNNTGASSPQQPANITQGSNQSSQVQVQDASWIGWVDAGVGQKVCVNEHQSLEIHQVYCIKRNQQTLSETSMPEQYCGKKPKDQFLVADSSCSTYDKLWTWSPTEQTFSDGTKVYKQTPLAEQVRCGKFVPDQPYLICSPMDFLAIKKHIRRIGRGSAKLNANLDFAGYAPIKSTFQYDNLKDEYSEPFAVPTGYFFDGNGFKISNIRFENAGMFFLWSNSKLLNLTVENPILVAHSGSGGILGGAGLEVTVKNCHVKNAVIEMDTAENSRRNVIIGGMFGLVAGIRMSDSSFQGKITIKDNFPSTSTEPAPVYGNSSFGYVGGLIGYMSVFTQTPGNLHSEITNSSATINIVQQNNRVLNIGGVVGMANGPANFRDITAKGIISAEANSTVGGLIGVGYQGYVRSEVERIQYADRVIQNGIKGIDIASIALVTNPNASGLTVQGAASQFPIMSNCGNLGPGDAGATMCNSLTP